MDNSTLKIILRSLLVANPTRVTVSILAKTFRESEGHEIPYRELGFSNLEEYLRSIPDCLTLIGYGPQAEVRAKISSKSAHVAELVAHQNSTTKSKSGRRMMKARHDFQSAKSSYSNCGNRNVNSHRNAAPVPERLPQNGNQRTQYLPERLEFAQEWKTRRPDRLLYQPTTYSQDSHLGRAQSRSRDCTGRDKSCSDRSPPRNGTARSTQSGQGDFKSSKNKFRSTHSQSTREDVRAQTSRSGSFSKYRHRSRHDYSSSDLSDFEESVGFNNKNYEADVEVEDRLPKVPPSKCIKGDEVFISDDESEIPLCKENLGDFNYKVPFNVQDNLKQLIRVFKDGMWVKNLADIYRAKYNLEIPFHEYGYSSLMDMCLTLSNIFNFKQGQNGMFKLYDKDIEPPDFELFEDYNRLHDAYDEIEPTLNVPAVPEKATMDLMAEEVEVPSDVMRMGDSIPPQSFNANPNEWTEICIGEVYDPSKFWFFLSNTNPSRLDKLMDNMQEFYANYSHEYIVPQNYLQKGLFCVIYFLDEYHRAIIVRFHGENKDTLKAFFFDFGTVSVVSSKGVLYLHNSFRELPMQGIRGRLARIWPKHVNEQWSRESASRFLNLISQKKLVAQVNYYDEKRRAYHLIVADTNGTKDIFINDKLVEEGYGVFTDKAQMVNPKITYKPIVKYLYLFPTFDELELALVPTALEMCVFLRTDVTLDRIYPQYFEGKKKEETLPLEASKDEAEAPEGMVTNKLRRDLNNVVQNARRGNDRQKQELQNTTTSMAQMRLNQEAKTFPIPQYTPAQVNYAVSSNSNTRLNINTNLAQNVALQNLFSHYSQSNQQSVARAPPPGFHNIQPNPSNFNALLTSTLVHNMRNTLNPYAMPFQLPPSNNSCRSTQPNLSKNMQPQQPFNVPGSQANPVPEKFVTELLLHEGSSNRIHGVTYNNQRFIVLPEIHRILYSYLSLTQLKRIIFVQCEGKLETVCLKTNPKLKDELIQYDLISPDCTSVELIPTTTFNQLMQIKL